MFDISRLSSYPEAPGVYVMKDITGTVLYVGKAKNIRRRLRQYFSPSGDNRVQVPILLSQLAEIEFIVSSDEEEALVLEATLIKKFLPKYNVLLKDDKSGLCIRIGHDHAWPRIEFVRQYEAADLSPKIFGPYASSETARKMFDLVVRCFQLRQCSDETFSRRKSPCLLFQIRRCTAPCVHKVSMEAYTRQVELAENVLSGKVAELRAELMRKMQEASEKMEYEQAAAWQNRLHLIESARPVSGKGPSIDAVGVWQEANRLAISVLHYRNHTLVYGESWEFALEETALGGEYQEQIAIQYYLNQAEEAPDEILVPQGEWDLQSLAAVLSKKFGKRVHVRQPIIGQKKAMVVLACSNAQAKLFAEKIDNDLLVALQKQLSLERIPQIIDCFDASHFSGKDLVAACVGFVDGKKNTSRYRTFRIRCSDSGNDLAMIQEAVERRYRNCSDIDPLPDMILVDGGKLQLQAVQAAIKQISESIDIVALSKEKGRHDRGIVCDVIHLVKKSEPLRLSAHSETLMFLQRIRDEAHRFVISFQRKRRSATAFVSTFDAIHGIGEKKRKKILSVFRGVEELKKASVEEIQQKSGIGRKDAEQVFSHFHPEAT